jgi:hypothetical protein
MITLHEGIPARAIQTLAAALDKPEEIARVANFPIIADKLAKENPEDDDKPAAEEKPDLNEKPEALE